MDRCIYCLYLYRTGLNCNRTKTGSKENKTNGLGSIRCQIEDLSKKKKKNVSQQGYSLQISVFKIKKIKPTSVLTTVFYDRERLWYSKHWRNCSSYNFYCNTITHSYRTTDEDFHRNKKNNSSEYEGSSTEYIEIRIFGYPTGMHRITMHIIVAISVSFWTRKTEKLRN